MAGRVALSVVASLAGAALLVWQIQLAGPRAVGRALAAIGPGFAVILLLSFVRFLCRTAAWHALLDAPIRFRRVLAAMLVGDALGNVTPLGLLASEPAKALYLGREVTRTRALAALTVENFFYGILSAIYIIIGAAAMLARFDVPESLRPTGLVVLAAMCAVLCLSAWLAWAKPSLATAIVAIVPLRRVQALAARLAAFEQHAYGSATLRPGRLAVVVASGAGFHLLSFVECWFTVWLLTDTSSPAAALVFDSVNRVINVTFKMVPMRAGVDEYGSVLAAGALGISPDLGLALALSRKARLIFWAAVAYGIVVQEGVRTRRDQVRG
jgi:hypothetical protein